MLRIDNRDKPHGVVLLLTLAMLVLFLLIGLTLVISAGNFKSAAKQFARVEASGDRPQETLDWAAMQLLRDTVNKRSSLYKQSLLEDMYGGELSDDALVAYLTAAPQPFGTSPVTHYGLRLAPV